MLSIFDGISVFAILFFFFYGMAILGTPKCPLLKSIDIIRQLLSIDIGNRQKVSFHTKNAPF